MRKRDKHNKEETYIYIECPGTQNLIQIYEQIAALNDKLNTYLFKQKLGKINTILLALISTITFLFGVLKLFLGSIDAIIFFIPFFVIGWVMPFYICIIRGSTTENRVSEQLRGWLYFVVGVPSYIIFTIVFYLLFFGNLFNSLKDLFWTYCSDFLDGGNTSFIVPFLVGILVLIIIGVLNKVTNKISELLQYKVLYLFNKVFESENYILHGFLLKNAYENIFLLGYYYALLSLTLDLFYTGGRAIFEPYILLIYLFYLVVLFFVLRKYERDMPRDEDILDKTDLLISGISDDEL